MADVSAQRVDGLSILGQKTLIYKKFPGIFRVLLEPPARASETETVAPRVHILHQAFPANSVDMIGQHDLQVTNGGLLEIIAARVTIKPLATIGCHAYDVATFVQQRMNGRVASHMNCLAYDSGFGVPPKAARDRLIVILYEQSETVSDEQ